MENVIYYGFGKDYLSNWGMKEAFREIYQNFLDYGKYDVSSVSVGSTVRVTLSNDWQPDSLDFLRIGNSNKLNAEAIGKHGEGLKMAFLILLRSGFESRIETPKFTVFPSTYVDKEIGECFCLRYEEKKQLSDGFSIIFYADLNEWLAFNENVIKPEDIIFTDAGWGSIVDKKKGNIYSGGLFVTYIEAMSKSYDINPSRLPLDRDRCVPRSMDVNYATSVINQAQGKFKTADLVHNDTMFITEVHEEIIEEFKPVIIGENKNVDFVYKDEKGEEVIVKNEYVKQALTRNSFFSGAINLLKRQITKKIGIHDLLLDFKKKHVHNSNAISDFNIILERIGEPVPEEEIDDLDLLLD